MLNQDGNNMKEVSMLYVKNVAMYWLTDYMMAVNAIPFERYYSKITELLFENVVSILWENIDWWCGHVEANIRSCLNNKTL